MLRAPTKSYKSLVGRRNLGDPLGGGDLGNTARFVDWEIQEGRPFGDRGGQGVKNAEMGLSKVSWR